MIYQISPVIVVLYIVFAIAVQALIDLYFTRPIIPGNLKRRAVILTAAGAASLLVTILLFRLFLPLNHNFLYAARHDGRYFAVAVIAVILEYFLWALPYIGIKGLIVRELAMSAEIREKRQAWWSYVMVSTVASVVVLGPLYIAVTIVAPLLLGMAKP